MADFSIAYKLTAEVEGFYVNDSTDKGGETFKGISRIYEPSWRGWLIIDKAKKENSFPNNLLVNEPLQKLVLALYKVNYWNPLSLSDILDQRMANELYDTSVNMGTGRAALFFQRVLNSLNRNGTIFPDLKLDAQVGPKTIGCFNALNAKDKYIAWELFNCLQGSKYLDICEANPSQEKYLRGWIGRVFES